MRKDRAHRLSSLASIFPSNQVDAFVPPPAPPALPCLGDPPQDEQPDSRHENGVSNERAS